LELRHLNNQIAHVSVRCSNGWAELPLKLAAVRWMGWQFCITAGPCYRNFERRALQAGL